MTQAQRQLHIGVVAHHSRSSVADDLMTRVSGDVIAMDVEDHPDLNDRIAATARNHLWALQLLGEISGPEDWCVVLEDDATPCDHFPVIAKAACLAAPSRLVGFYLGTGNPSGVVQRAIIPAINRAKYEGCDWIVGDPFLSAVAYAMPAHLIDDLSDFTRDRGEEWPLRVTRWAQHRGIDVSYTAPSLVDHDRQPSVIYPCPDAQPRRAHWFKPQAHVDRNGRSVRLGYCGSLWGRATGTALVR